VFPDVGRKVPFGAGATLAYNYIDLQVLNETMDDFKVELWLDDDFLYRACPKPPNHLAEGVTDT
jgi:vancomycin resistance protein VanW